AVWGYVERTTPEGIHPGVARAIPAVCIGPSTAEAARQAEFQSVLVASEQSTGGLAAALTDALAHHSREVPA
ncbi:MAG: uroporphyrinogen-III synthase, partial [Chloroflexota bacterium]|nr:uroporphyrinogen-III synthase [Chloroflexota bacterium]